MKRYNCELGIVPFVKAEDGYWVTYDDVEDLKNTNEYDMIMLTNNLKLDILRKQNVIDISIEVLDKLEKRYYKCIIARNECFLLLALILAIEIVKAFN
jgi:hypothetical protein